MGAQSLSVRPLTILAGLVVLILSVRAVAQGCPGADPEALAWLDKMSRSSHEVNYHGVVTLQRGESMQVMQVSHSVANGSASESLTRLTGQGAQVVRVEHPLDCVHPGHRLLRIGTRMQEGNCGISSNYRFRVGKGERVAGRNAVRIQIEPRDMYRYGYVMELDRETGLLLKTRTLGAGNKTLERFQFANLSFAPVSPGTADVEVVHKASHTPPPSSNTPVSASNWKVVWIPPGFMLTDAPASGSSRKTYTDGLAVFSVFLEELPAQMQPGEGIVRSGPTTSYTRGMSRSEQPILVTVIGEVPVNTARMVADSIGWTQ